MVDNPFNEEYMRGFNEGKKHTTSSPDTNRRFKELESLIQDLPTEKEVISQYQAILDSIQNLRIEFNEKIEKLESQVSKKLEDTTDRYLKVQSFLDKNSAKWDQGAENWKWLSRIVGTAVVLALLALIGLK